MQPGRLKVDVVALRGMGTVVADAGATLRETVKATGPGLSPTADPGSAAGTAAQAAATAWLASLRRLASEVEQLSRSMTGAADSYQTTDQAGADEIRPGGSAVYQ